MIHVEAWVGMQSRLIGTSAAKESCVASLSRFPVAADFAIPWLVVPVFNRVESAIQALFWKSTGRSPLLDICDPSASGTRFTTSSSLNFRRVKGLHSSSFSEWMHLSHWLLSTKKTPFSTILRSCANCRNTCYAGREDRSWTCHCNQLWPLVLKSDSHGHEG